MKKFKRLLALVLGMVVLLGTWPAALVYATEETVTPTAFSLECHNKTGYVGYHYGGNGIVSYEFEPYGARESVEMVSSDPSIASLEYISESDHWDINCHKVGTVIITATTASGFTDTCTVTVKEMEEVQLGQPFEVTVEPGDEVKYLFTPNEGAYYSFYEEYKEGLLSIRADSGYYNYGVDTSFLQAGNTITIGIWNNSDTAETYTVRIREAAPVESIIFEQEQYYGYPGESEVIRVSLSPIWSIPEEPVFSSSDESVVYYDPPGSRWVTLANPGTATITATTENGVSAQCTVNVLAYEPIALGESKTLTLNNGDDRRYEFTPETDGEYVFYMREGEFVPVKEDEYGIVSGYSKDFSLDILCDRTYVGESVYISGYKGVSYEMKAGEKYELRASNKWSNTDVTITGTVSLGKMTPPTRITISSTLETVHPGESFSLSCVPDTGLPFVSGEVIWEVSDETILQMDATMAGQAWFNAIDIGTAVVTATLENGVSSNYEVVVSEYVFNDYSVISGQDAVVTAGTGDPLVIQIDCPVEKFDSLVVVDGVEISSACYTVTEGSTIITLTTEYLDTLSIGEHWMYVIFTDGSAFVNFEIKEKSSIEGTLQRVYGATRYDTAFKAADQLKENLGIEKFENIVVAYGEDFADALSGSYLANQKNAPILLVKNRNKEINLVKDYIKANLTSGGTVYLLGGVNAVPKAMETGLEGFNVKRLAGATRYETNLEILKEAGISGNDILVCTGLDFADGLSASAVNKPILLVKDSLRATQVNYLKTLGTKNFYLIGGTNAVNKRIESALSAYGTTQRIEGATRYYTSVNIAKTFFPNTKTAVLAYAQNFPDGLSGGCLACSMNAPLILTANGKQAPAVAYAKEAGITGGAVLGGTGLIPDKVANAIFQIS